MSVNEAGRAPVGSKWRGNRVVIAAAAVVFGGLVALGAISPGYGLLGFVVLVLAALLANRACRGGGPACPAGRRGRTRRRAA